MEQDNTIGTDGYPQPSDIGDYQVQVRYTNPHTFISTPDFEGKCGVNVRAIKQLWHGTIDMWACQELKTYDGKYYSHLYYSDKVSSTRTLETALEL